MGTRWTRSWAAGLTVLGVATAGIVPGAAALAPVAHEGEVVDVIVDASSSDRAASAVHAVGGTVTARLEVIGGVAASVTATAVTRLEAQGLAVHPDRPVAPADHDAARSAVPTGSQVDALHPGTAGGPDAGAGVGVALIDTGVSPHPNLTAVRAGVDLSAGEVAASRAPGDAGALVDGYGHGTFIAGLIAGHHTGVAPGAEIISIKVAGDDGDTDLGTLIAAIGWAVVHQDDLGIDVLNLSFGSISPMAPPGDPLVQAVEAAWASGLVVVVASGNEGPGTVTSPGTSARALTIGATDHHGTAGLADDTPAPWSGSAEGRAPKPELVVPGTSVVSLRVPGSAVDMANPDSALLGQGGSTHLVGSGTSMATGLASGAVAVVLAHHPEATPGDVKSALVDTAAPVAGGWTVDLERAVGTAVVGTVVPAPGVGLTVPTAGRTAVAGQAGWAGARWTGARWTDSEWAGARWTGARWTGARWTGARWTGARWTGARWTGARWTGARWTGVDLG